RRARKSHHIDKPEGLERVVRPTGPKRILQIALQRWLDELARPAVEKAQLGDGNFDNGRLGRRRGGGHLLGRGGLELEPIERVGAEAEGILRLAHCRKHGAAKKLDGCTAASRGKIELHMLDEPREIGNDENLLIAIAPNECQDLAVRGVQKLKRAAAEG